MSQYFLINGKEYLPSAEIARRFSYTPDYVSRLAREGKIVASNVNRKWFIDVDSFTEFQKSSDSEKEQRAKALQSIRKKERQLHLQNKAHEKRRENERVYIAMTQSFAIFVCIAFVGLLGWTVVDSEMSIGDVSFGVEQTYQQVAQVIAPGVKSFGAVTSLSFALVMQSSKSQPAVSSGEDSNVSFRTSDSSTEATLFSDEVELLYAQDGVRVVRPVFSNENLGQAYQVTPVPAGGRSNRTNE